jgi:DNA modification methylase
MSTENDNSRKRRRGRRIRSRRAAPLPSVATPRSIAGSNELRIEERPVDLLKAFPRNARVHSKKQIHQIAASIREFGFTNPILIDQADVIIAGHGRVEAARSLGLQVVPTIRIEHLSDAQKRAYVIADNKLALNAGWDREILAIEFQHLSGLDLEFDIEITGFETAEIDLLADAPGTQPSDDPADWQPTVVAQAVSRLGDLWQLGDHKLLCGDARDPETYATVLDEERARLMFADPPYNVRIDGHVGGLGSIKHREFAMASGEMTAAQFTNFLRMIFLNAVGSSLDGAIHFVCMDWRHLSETLAASRTVYSELKNLCVWNKDNGGMGSFYRSKHELIFVFKVGIAPHINTIELGRSGRYRTNVWDYAGVNTMRSGRLDELAMHPTVKPVALIVDAIKDCSRRGDIVLDPFAGSGTTVIAAEKSRRRARAIEIDPAYVDVAIKRWQRLTSATVMHATSGKSFAEIAQERCPNPVDSVSGFSSGEKRP